MDIHREDPMRRRWYRRGELEMLGRVMQNVELRIGLEGIGERDELKRGYALGYRDARNQLLKLLKEETP
jgi:hypothetical protein